MFVHNMSTYHNNKKQAYDNVVVSIVIHGLFQRNIMSNIILQAWHYFKIDIYILVVNSGWNYGLVTGYGRITDNTKIVT